MSLYRPKHFVGNDRAAVARLIHERPFATLVTPAMPEPVITHLPLVHVADCEPHGALLGHFARPNPHVAAAADAQSVAIFHGPHAYVSPSWYAQPAAGVPTWNYAVVHAHGRIELARDASETRSILDAMIQRFESSRHQPWAPGLSAAEFDAMLRAIVGFRIRIQRVEAKFKLSQNRAPEDRGRVVAALAAEADAEANATAAWMREYVIGSGGDGDA